MNGLWLNARIIGTTALPNPNHTATSVAWTTTNSQRPPTSLFAGNSCNRHAYDHVLVDTMEDKKEESVENGNWVLRVLQMRSLWKAEEANNNHGVQLNHSVQNEKDDEVSIHEECACMVDDDNKLEFDKNSFSKLLSTVSLSQARLYAQMAYLGSLSYTIPKIKLGNLLKRHRLRFVTSSLEKKTEAKKEKVQHQEGITKAQTLKSKDSDDSSEDEAGENAKTALFMASIDAKDEVKHDYSLATSDDLNSTSCSSPCEWFICDDNENNTRYFVIQGSESLASWQANLLFEPIQFEAQDAIVHRGIYKAAKVVYEDILPQVHKHLQGHGNGGSIRLTGHSLGGSLSLLVNLMLLIRGQVPPSCLLPVVTFGAPWVMCGGDRLLHKLGLPRNHLQGITTHRDIVPRAFSCNYPTRVAELLKAVNGNFRNHPCLNKQNVLYAPMGELLILQPDAKVSPSHELLPSGSGLYILRSDQASKKERKGAWSVFLNTPHPLQILSERSAYASILRDHDVETYLTSIRSVICDQLNRVRRMRREDKSKFWWDVVGRSRSRDDDGGGMVMVMIMIMKQSDQVKLLLKRWLIMDDASNETQR